MSFARMNRVLELDAPNRRARVQPGVVNLDFSREIASSGFFYAPDPSSQKVCTLGGNIGTNAGGPHCLSYGQTVNHVLGLEVVDAEGEVFTTSCDDTGYDLTGTLVGSEGTLGIVTSAWVNLLQQPEAVRVWVAAFADVEAACETVSAIVGAGILPTALEIMDKLITEAVEAHYHAGYPTGAGAVLLVEIAGAVDDMDASENIIAKIAREKKIISVSDNTFATPWIQRPIEAGFDMVVHSATKYLNGHSDMVGGVIVVGENKELADQSAVDAMRQALDGVDMNGIVVIGEGEKDEAPMLYIGEQVGNGSLPEVDVAVDPVEGTELLSLGLPGALAVIATAERGTMYVAPPGVFYMEKIAVGPTARHVIDINAPVATNLARIARARDARIDDLVVVILDRPRHQEIMRQIREVGARIRLITDGDVSAAIQAAMEDYTGIDALIGIGGAPEAVLAAAAIKCTGGEIQCKIWPRSDEERERLKADGIDVNQVLQTDDLVKGNDVSFAATGITSGELAEGVQYFGWGARTSSIMMRSRSGTIRFIESTVCLRICPTPSSLGAESKAPSLNGSF